MTDIYRDPTDGATARRVDLLRRRRDELVTMPHAIRRVVVARGARMAASLAMAFIGALLVGSAGSARISRLVGHLLPPDDPAVIATGLLAAWLGGVLVYAIARSIAEHRFAVAMTKCVLPGEDLHDDLERLAHEQPDEVARRMAHRLEIRSAALPVMAAAFVGPATLAYLRLAAKVHGWPANRFIEHSLGDHAGDLILAALIGLVATLAVLSPKLRGPRAAVPAGIVAVTALVIAIALRDTATFWMTLPVIATAGTIALMARKLRIERAWIETEDPAAGTELFDLIARRFGELRRFVVAHAGMLTFVAAAFGFGIVGHASLAEVPHAQPDHSLAIAFQHATTPIVSEVQDPTASEPTSASVHMSREDYGTLDVDVAFDGNGAEVATGLVIPSGWDARIEAHVDREHSQIEQFTVEGVGTLTDSHPFEVSMPIVCATQPSVPIRLHITTATSGHHTIRVVLQPTLRASKC